MVGIVSFGGYVPRLRLNRKSIVNGVGWLAPGIAGLAQGEKALCNWDEDSITMAVNAAQDCLGGIAKARVDALYLASTTLPFADRLNAGIVGTALNLRDDMLSMDCTSSQKAGTSALVTALEAIQGGARHNILVAAADKRAAKPASSFEMLFGDGAAALLLGDQEVIAELEGSYSISCDFVDHYRGAQHQFDYTWEERWVRDEGYTKILPQAINGLAAKLGFAITDIDRLVYPCPSRRDHPGIARLLGIAPEKVQDNLHQVCGETGVAHPLVMLVAALEQAKPGERIVVSSFGQGADVLSFRVTENIKRLAPRTGIAGSLAKKKVTDNYVKYLKFRELLQTETGIRAEAPNQTALSTLWRKRKMILGLVGGKCRECGTPQFPKMDICVNPRCNAAHSQEDYEFGGVPATVKSFTGDMLAVSVDPPAVYGMVQFQGGGRFMSDFTDCELADVRVGFPVKMSFRRHLVDADRGFTGYFWKAVPQVEAVAAGPQATAG